MRNCLFFCLRVSVAAACTLYEGIAVGTFGHRGVCLVSAHRDAVERAVVLGHKIVTALGYIALDALVFLHFVHSDHLCNIICPCGQ